MIHQIVVDLPDGDHEYLKACARIRKISCGRLVQRILLAVSQGQLVLAVLDDDSKATPQEAGEANKSKCHGTELFAGCK